MRRWVLFLGLFSGVLSSWASEPGNAHPVTDIVIIRTAEQLQAPHILTYRVLEWTELRGRWIFPDIGYFDTGYGKDQIWFVAGGAEILHRRRFQWNQELYLTQEAGPESHDRRSLWIWPILNPQLSSCLSSQIVPYLTIPLNSAQHRSLDIDRAKLEWRGNSRWVMGVGYAGGLAGQSSWQSQPFLTVTRKSRAGHFEVWLQQTAGGGQVQLRYMLAREQR